VEQERGDLGKVTVFRSRNASPRESRTSEPSGDSALPRDVSAVHIRALESLEDCDDCVKLQRDVWGFGEEDIVPASLLHIVAYVGGIAAGAYGADGMLLGFVFGISGIHDGELAHWSHMLGVRESARNLGVGRKLKEHQRAELARMNVARIFWTFDPLMAKNAYFNLNRLGAEVVGYVPNMYGITHSPLHLGLPTDRLVVCVTTAAPLAPARAIPLNENPRVMTPFPQPGDRVFSANGERPDIVLVEMPASIRDDMAAAPAVASAWRMSLRENFQWALSNGYLAKGVHRTLSDGRSFYVMEREGPAV
jgi:predicted GNAT superfamily acetyltransferase